MSKFFDNTLREKYPNTEFFQVCIFPHSDWIQILCISRYSVQMWKIRTRKNSVSGHFTLWYVFKVSVWFSKGLLDDDTRWAPPHQHHDVTLRLTQRHGCRCAPCWPCCCVCCYWLLGLWLVLRVTTFVLRNAYGFVTHIRHLR